jgi:hypothetical protein
MSNATDVIAVFKAARDAFNEQQFGTLMSYIDQNATIYSITGQVQYAGYEAVEGYFYGQFKETPPPKFNPTFYSATLPAPVFNTKNTTASMTGWAQWTSVNHVGGYKLEYIFTFSNRGKGSNPWLFLTMWGS